MSFRVKTILGIALIEALLLLLLVWSALDFLGNSNRELLASRIDATTRLAEVMVRDAVITTDIARLDELMQSLLTLPGVTYADVHDAVGTLASAGLPAHGGDDGVGASPEPRRVAEGQIDKEMAITVGGQTFGQLHIGFDGGAVSDLLGSARGWLVTLALVELVLVALFSWFLGRYLTGTLSDLAAGAEAVSGGSMSARIPVRGRDEIAQTAHAFNRMVERLAEQRRVMEESVQAARRAHQETVRSEQYLRALFDSAADAVIVIDRHGTIQRVNGALERLLGYSPRGLEGRNVSQLMPEPHRTAHDGYLAEYLRTGQARVIGVGREVEAQHRDGTLVPVDLSITELVIDDEQQFVGLLRDIRERKAIERLARREQSIKSMITDASLDALVTIDSDGRVVEFNPAAEAIFGYSKSKLLGEPMAEYLIPEELRAMHHIGLRRYLESGEAKLIGSRVEVEALHASGKQFPVELALVANEVDGATLFTAFIRDISERKQAQTRLLTAVEAAEQASRAKSRFLAHMSHELRSPLNAVLGTLELLAATALDDRQGQLMDIAAGSGRMLLDLMNDVLDFSRIEAGHLALEPAEVHLPSLVDQVLDALAPRALAKGVELLCAHDPALPATLWADGKRLRQVIHNLVDNAVKFTGSGVVCVTSQRMTLAPGEAFLRLVVRDTGIGIPAERCESIFSEFEQVDDTGAAGYGGTGLGLAITRQLVERMDGNIVATNDPGGGARFEVTLPLGEEYAIARRAPPVAYPHTVHVLSANRPLLDALAEGAALRGTNLIGWEIAAGRPSTALAGLDAKLADGDTLLIDAAALDIAPATLQWLRSNAHRKFLLRNPFDGAPGNPDWLRERDAVLFKPIKLDALCARLTGAQDAVEPFDRPQAAVMLRVGSRVLVVDDIPANRLIARAMLESARLRVDEAEDGASAVAMAGATRYDAILMDVRMPGTSGTEATAQIRAAGGASRATPILAVTANADKDELEHYRTAGMNACVTKPYTRRQLLNALVRWLAPSGDAADAPPATSAADETAEPLLDAQTLAQLARDTSEAAVPGMLEMFVTEVEQRRDALQAAVANAALDPVGQEAHALKGLCATFGARRLRGRALALERAVGSAREAEIPRLHRQLQACVAQTLEAYRAHLATAA